ncbi:hypothetical protein H8A87_08235, partial [Xenorhabdus sp. VLS]|nr:hypothetical protein [Xenorhabdus lircayensis]
MLYAQGTISTVSGSAMVRGTGTRFKSNINGVAPAQLMLIQSGSGNLLHMIQAVNSDTELVLADNVSATLNNVTYQIQTTAPDSISDGVRHIVANSSYIVNFLQNMDKWMSQNGVVNVTLPNGQTVALQSIRALQAEMDRKLDRGRNGADIQDKAAFVRNIGLGDALKVRDYGIGSNELVNTNYVPYLWHVGGDQPSGFYGYTPDSDKKEQWGSFIKLRWNAENQQYLIFPNFGSNAMRIVRFIGGKVWEDYTVWTTGNTTEVDGYLKSASPIIKIWSDSK